MANKVVRYLILSQLSLYIFLGICIFIIPGFLFGKVEGGASNYGVHGSTVIPFTLAFVLSGVFLIWASNFILKTSKNSRRIRRALCVQAVLLFSVMLSTYPYKLNQTYNYIHITAGLLLLFYNIAFVAWVALHMYKNRTNILLLIVEFAGFLLTFLTLSGFIHWLFVAQAITSLTFSVFIIRLGSRVSSELRDNKS